MLCWAFGGGGPVSSAGPHTCADSVDRWAARGAPRTGTDSAPEPVRRAILPVHRLLVDAVVAGEAAGPLAVSTGGRDRIRTSALDLADRAVTR